MGDAIDPNLSQFRATIAATNGARLNRVALFSSRARGEAGQGSDYDLAVFLKTFPSRWSELDRLSDLRARFLDETGAYFLYTKPYVAAAYGEATPLMHEIQRGCVELGRSLIPNLSLESIAPTSAQLR